MNLTKAFEPIDFDAEGFFGYPVVVQRLDKYLNQVGIENIAEAFQSQYSRLMHNLSHIDDIRVIAIQHHEEIDQCGFLSFTEILRKTDKKVVLCGKGDGTICMAAIYVATHISLEMFQKILCQFENDPLQLKPLIEKLCVCLNENQSSKLLYFVNPEIDNKVKKFLEEKRKMLRENIQSKIKETKNPQVSSLVSVYDDLLNSLMRENAPPPSEISPIAQPLGERDVVTLRAEEECVSL